MKRIRCKECGMSIAVKEGQIFATCPICNARTNVATAEKVPSIDDAYDVSDYNKNISEHDKEHVYVDRVEEEKKNSFFKNATQSKYDDSIKNQEQSKKKVTVIVFSVIFIIWVIITMIIDL